MEWTLAWWVGCARSDIGRVCRVREGAARLLERRQRVDRGALEATGSVHIALAGFERAVRLGGPFTLVRRVNRSRPTILQREPS